MVEMKFFRLYFHPLRPECLLVLADKEEKRALPIVIGIVEGFAIARLIAGEIPRRPFTHELLVNILSQVEAKVEKLVITRLYQNIFFANLEINFEEKSYTIDCRPSDGIFIALATDSPIFVAEEVLEENGVDFYAVLTADCIPCCSL